MISDPRWAALLVSGAVLGGLFVCGLDGKRAQAAGPLGRPVLPRPAYPQNVPGPSGVLPLDPGPAVLTPPLPRPGPVPGTLMIPGYWQGNRWVPGRLEIRKSRPTRWIPGYFTPEGRWVRGRWQ